jgi:putative transposase
LLFLKQGDEGVAVTEVCREAGISEATYYDWHKKYGGLIDPLREDAPET